MISYKYILITDQYLNAIYGLKNRQSYLKEDTNTFLDIINTVYLERDVEDIARVMEELKSSNCSNTTIVAEDLLKTFIFTPFERVKGTAREQVISAGIDHVISSNLYLLDLPTSSATRFFNK